ncbi:MAG TPA: tyrosine-type recombinase/integrase [Anaerolineaceae bacterium]|nr:tyrosine-type recombinase/integrase [Anaerolineaceae bacterium]
MSSDLEVLTGAEIITSNALVLFPGMEVAERGLPRPDVFDMMMEWGKAFELWRGSLKSDNTRRAYQTAWDSLQNTVGKYVWSINSSDVFMWVEMMRRAGLSQATINQRVAGVSAFYWYIVKDYRITKPDGSETALRTDNPAVSRNLREKVNPYGKAMHLDVVACRALLGAIPRNTLQGLRDYALFLGYLYTGRRNSEWRTIQWGQFEKQGRKIFYVWSGKGKFNQKHELPATVWDAVLAWLHAAGRDNPEPKEYIFTALSDRATRLPNVYAGAYDPAAQPLSMREVGSLLKRYARKAGLDPEGIHVHILRHTAAMLRKAAGDDVKKIQALLAHSSLAVTDIYLHQLEGNPDDSWAKVDTLLGL